MRVLIVGCGYIGLPLGAELVRQGQEVFGLRRSSGAKAELKSAGIRPLTGDITKPSDLAKLPTGYDWVVNCAASAGGGVEDYRALYLEGTRNLVEWLSSTPPKKYVYTSSTSVYGQTEGELVTETSPTDPAAETGRILVRAEQVLLEASQASGFPAVILRLAGIYGPNRGHWFKQFLKNEAAIEGKGERILNMIHRDDVVGATIAALIRGRPGAVYNVADTEPVAQLAFFQWLAGVLGKALPPFGPEMSEAARKRGLTNKKVSNAKLRTELGYEFKYPTFREGYGAEVREIRSPESEIRKKSEI